MVQNSQMLCNYNKNYRLQQLGKEISSWIRKSRLKHKTDFNNYNNSYNNVKNSRRFIIKSHDLLQSRRTSMTWFRYTNKGLNIIFTLNKLFLKISRNLWRKDVERHKAKAIDRTEEQLDV